MKRMLEILVVAVIASAGVLLWKAGTAPARPLVWHKPHTIKPSFNHCVFSVGNKGQITDLIHRTIRSRATPTGTNGIRAAVLASRSGEHPDKIGAKPSLSPKPQNATPPALTLGGEVIRADAIATTHQG